MTKPRIVVVGAGFAGFQAARALSRKAHGRYEVVMINPNDYFLYLPLLPEVSSGVLEPRRVTVSLPDTLPAVRLVLGEVDGVDLDGHRVTYTDQDGRSASEKYDRLVLAAGSVNKLLPIPGVAEYAHGFRGITEALYLRDHIVRQLELAAVAEDEEERAARSMFVVVGAGYTGTEVAATGVLFTKMITRGRTFLHGVRPKWMLLDVAERVLPELDPRLSRTADRVLRRRGVDVRMQTSVKEAHADGVLLTTGDNIATRSLIWCVGVRPDPLVAEMGLPTVKGRLSVDEFLAVPGHPDVFACGDAAAVPDLTRPGEIAAMTGQHAQRQGKRAAHNLLASMGIGSKAAYKHHDLGFVVDLGGWAAAANPVHIPLSGPVAKAVTRGYHLLAMPGNRLRVVSDWLVDAVQRRQAMQLGLVPGASVPLDTTSPDVPPVHKAHRAVS
jgi:NADH:ubiquinone reductase (H+-translocating)